MVQYSETWLKLLTAFLVVILGLIIGQISSNIIKRFLKSMELNKILEDQLKIKLQLEKYLASTIKYIIYFATAIIALNTIGIPTRVLQIILIIFLILIILFIILAFKDWLPNLISGFYILRTQRIKKGDTIKSRGITGKVIQINLLETKIETNNNEVIFIPNHNLTRYEVTKVHKQW